MTGRPVKMAPELRTSLLTEVVLAALGVGAADSPLVTVSTTGSYTATVSVAPTPMSDLWCGGMDLALTTQVGGVSQAVVSAAACPALTKATREKSAWRMRRLAEAIEAEPGVTDVAVDPAYGLSVLVRLSYGRLRIIREGGSNA